MIRRFCFSEAKSSAKSEDIRQRPSVINKISAFLSSKSSSCRDSRSGDSKFVPPPKKCCAHRSRDSGVYFPGENRSVCISSADEKWTTAHFRFFCDAISTTARAKAFAQSRRARVLPLSSMQTILSPSPFTIGVRVLY